MLNYEDEIRGQITSNLWKIAFPVLIPLYLLLNIYDWVSLPSFGPGFLLLRLSILPVAGLSYWSLTKNWSGPWHLFSVWLLGFMISFQWTVMAGVTGRLSAPVYAQGIHMLAGVLLFLFPMSLSRNLLTLFSVYSSSCVLFLADLFLPSFRIGAAFPIAIQYAGMMAIFCVAATALDRLRAKTFKQKMDLFFMATTDALSGLKLRRYFFSRFIQELSLRFRKEMEIVMSVAVFDLDSFKKLNDEYGHQMGDRCIRHVGELIRRHIRIYDVACRFGGEEFILLLPVTRITEAEMVCERIRKTIQDSPLTDGDRQIPVTVSIGISGFQTLISDEVRKSVMNDQKNFLVKNMMRVIHEADSSLYEAKKQGKNRVCVGTPVELSHEIEEDELSLLKGYFVYFEQAASLLETEPSLADMPKADYEFNFYSPEFFFRRCAEGLYRRYRDPEWRETLTIMKVTHSNLNAVQKEFCNMFRLADVVCTLEPGVYGILFVAMRPEALEHVAGRIRQRITDIPGSGKKEVKIAAAELSFDNESVQRLGHSLSYADFSKKVEELLQVLQRYRFPAGQEIYFHQPRPDSIPKAG